MFSKLKYDQTNPQFYDNKSSTTVACLQKSRMKDDHESERSVKRSPVGRF